MTISDEATDYTEPTILNLGCRMQGTGSLHTTTEEILFPGQLF